MAVQFWHDCNIHGVLFRQMHSCDAHWDATAGNR
jgi:hypothetical protein